MMYRGKRYASQNPAEGAARPASMTNDAIRSVSDRAYAPDRDGG